LGRQAAARRLLDQHLVHGPGAVLGRGLDDDRLVPVLDRRVGALEVEAGCNLPSRLVDRVGQLGGIELGDHVEGVFLRHDPAPYDEWRMLSTPATHAATASAITSAALPPSRSAMPSWEPSTGSELARSSSGVI